MAILFPPIIESKIPAQAESLKIYYTPNPMVTTFETLAIKVKTISTNTEIITDYVDEMGQENNNYYFIYTPKENNFLQQDDSLSEFYKIQVAYVEKVPEEDNEKEAQLQNLYWSSVGIFKWTKAPIINQFIINKNFIISANYSLNDITEPIYSYELEIINEETNSSVYKVNNLYKQIDEKPQVLFEIQPNINFQPITGGAADEGPGYEIKLMIKTINGYTLIINNSLYFDIEAWWADEFGESSNVIQIEFDRNNLSCIVQFHHEDFQQEEELRLIRNNQFLDTFQDSIFKDYSISSDEYIYEIQWGSNVIDKPRNGRMYTIIRYYYQKSNPILIDFEDMYLSDKDHLLCLRFNPKISSFKETVLESKQDTIGGRYPFFFRNGNTKYKEFSINGLISYHMDNNETFLNRGRNSNTMQRQSTNDNSTDSSFIPTTQLTGRNIYEEREFKLAVLEWLNNGRPKLFRSPTEGAYLVRLMNISLSPEDQLGRMLHSFQATAYEIDECTLENLRKYDCLYEEE